MRQLHAWFQRCLGLFLRSRRDRELEAEIASHIELHIDDNVRAGMSPEQARREAILAFGSVEAIKESCRDRRGVPVIDNLTRDVAWGWRVLRRDPGFAVLAVLTLALGIAATTAMFSIVDAVLLRPLPYPEANRLVSLNAVGQRDPSRLVALSGNMIVALRERATTLEQVVAQRRDTATLIAGEPRLVRMGSVSRGFFDLFGGTAAVGRTLLPADHADDSQRVAVLSHSLWQSAWGGDPSIVGSTVTLSDELYLVVGVMPPDFRAPEAVAGGDVDLWAPRLDLNHNQEYRTAARLATGATPASAQAEVDAIIRELTEGLPGQTYGRVTPLKQRTVGDIGDTLTVFLGGALLLLLIACANVAYLLLARGLKRRPELIMRTALGAHRGRIARQLLVESLLLAMMGGAAGALAAYAIVSIFRAADPGTIPRFAEVVVDGRILGAALALAGLSGIVFGLAPMLQLSRNNPAAALRAETPGSGDGPSSRRLRSLLVVAQTALALVLLVGAGLLASSLAALADVDPGFDPTGLALLEVRAPVTFAEREMALPFFDELLNRTRAIPGVDAAALATTSPYRPAFRWAYVPEGWEEAAERGEQPFFRGTAVSMSYLQLLRMSVVTGRSFDDEDRPGAPPVALVNEAFVRAYWPGDDAIGKWIRTFSGPFTVVGVVGDVRSAPASSAEPEIFMLASQHPSITMTVVARTSGAPADLIPAMRQAVWAIDPDLPIRSATTMDAITAEHIAGPRFYALLSSSFAGAALLLALVGVYGTASHAASRRRRELGIRVALGAEATAIVRLVMRDGLVLAGAGLLLGSLASRFVGDLLSGVLFGVSEGDTTTLAAGAAFFLATSCIANLIPALRAALTDPVTALRRD